METISRGWRRSSGWGFGPDGVAGCEVVTRKLEFSITRQVDGITPGYLRTMFAQTGTVNDRIWWGFAGNSAGYSEVLFTGFEAQGRDDGAFRCAWHFAVSPNRNEYLFPGAANKKDIGGWDFVWYVFGQPTASSGFPVSTPKWAYVEQVYKTSDFTQLGVFQ